MTAPRITVAGSVNLDLVTRCAHLPAPGETVLGGVFAQHPGGKGANQALAARLLGAQVALIGCVGSDSHAEAALGLLMAAGVDLTGCASVTGSPTGVALIAVSEDGENQIVVAPGANGAFTPDRMSGPIDGALIAQLEIPVATVDAAVSRCEGFVTLNLAPACDIPDCLLQRADLIVVNEGEAEFYDPERLKAAGGLLAITLGSAGAILYRDGKEVARAVPPPVEVRDTTGAGDTFVAALTLALIEGQSEADALRFACAASALSGTRAGAQPSLPQRKDVDAILAPGKTGA